MIEYKQGVTAKVPVRLLDTSGSGVTGVLVGAISVTVVKSDGTVQNVTPAGGDWTEITTGAFNGTGMYELQLSGSSFLNITGAFTYAVANASAKTYLGTVKIVAYEEVDTKAVVDRLRRLNEGRWKIFTAGGDANRLVLFDSDGTSVLQKWDLKDQSGSATTTNVFERVPTVSIP
jgi:hypothetical protein